MSRLLKTEIDVFEIITKIFLTENFFDISAEISETSFRVSIPRPSRPIGQSRHRDRDRDFISKVSRPRLIETDKFLSCRDRDSSRLENFLVVETETD